MATFGGSTVGGMEQHIDQFCRLLVNLGRLLVMLLAEGAGLVSLAQPGWEAIGQLHPLDKYWDPSG